MKLPELIAAIEEDWAKPRFPWHHGETGELELVETELVCKFDRTPARHLEQISFEISAEMKELWSLARKAVLFKDCKYGQWGLELLYPLDALKVTRELRRDRPRDYRRYDLVIGRFLGDQELLILLSDERSPDFGAVMVALEIDPRKDWPIVADGIGQFLERLWKASGEKYWELPDFAEATEQQS